MAFNFNYVLQQWEYYGVYDFILPFLLIFAVVFGILHYMKIFRDNKGVQVIVAVVLGLLAIQTRFFTDFLRVISPRLGVGLVILLGILILIGLFVPEKSQGTLGWVLMGVGVVIALIILGQSAKVLNFWGTGVFSDDIVAWLVLIGLLLGVIVAIVIGAQKKENKVAEKLASLFEGKE